MGWIKRRINKEESKYEGRLDWGLSAEKKLIETIRDWCYKNNTFQVGHLKLGTTDGGWVNVLKLKAFLDGERQSGFVNVENHAEEKKT